MPDDPRWPDDPNLWSDEEDSTTSAGGAERRSGSAHDVSPFNDPITQPPQPNGQRPYPAPPPQHPEDYFGEGYLPPYPPSQEPPYPGFVPPQPYPGYGSPASPYSERGQQRNTPQSGLPYRGNAQSSMPQQPAEAQPPYPRFVPPPSGSYPAPPSTVWPNTMPQRNAPAAPPGYQSIPGAPPYWGPTSGPIHGTGVPIYRDPPRNRPMQPEQMRAQPRSRRGRGWSLPIEHIVLGAGVAALWFALTQPWGMQHGVPVILSGYSLKAATIVDWVMTGLSALLILLNKRMGCTALIGCLGIFIIPLVVAAAVGGFTVFSQLHVIPTITQQNVLSASDRGFFLWWGGIAGCIIGLFLQLVTHRRKGIIGI